MASGAAQADSLEVWVRTLEAHIQEARTPEVKWRPQMFFWNPLTNQLLYSSLLRSL